MMRVKNTIDVYELNGEETKIHFEGAPVLNVCSHWNYTDRIVLDFEGKKITVLAASLEKAIKNATNHGRS